MRHTAVLYTKEGCHLCHRARDVLDRLREEFDLEVEEEDITGDPILFQRYQHTIPVVVIDDKHRFESKIAEYYLRRVLTPRTRPGWRRPGPMPEDVSAGRRKGNGDGQAPVDLDPRVRQAIRAAQRASFWFARHWLALANSANLLVLGLSVAVPGMRAMGLPWLADPIFGSYQLICHQLPYRAFFLFGYQMPMCQRNVAIYGSMALAGLAFGLARDRLRPLPWRWYLALALPMAVDGFTQLLEMRESNWELRLLTGSLFGTASVWLAYPYLERFARDILAGDRG